MNLKKEFQRLLGISLIFAGLFISFSNRLITGYAISSQVQDYFLYFNFFGIFIFISGVLFVLSSKQEGELEKKVRVFDRSHGKGNMPPGQRLAITDPELYFSRTGFVSLEEFRRGYESVRNDYELLNMVEKYYKPQLIKIIKNSQDEEVKRIAREFWKVFHENISVNDETVGLSDDEKNRILNAFKGGWKNNPNSKQKEILRDYRLDYEHGTKHGRIYSPDRKHIVTTSSTTADRNTGRIIGKEIIRMIEDYRASERN